MDAFRSLYPIGDNYVASPAVKNPIKFAGVIRCSPSARPKIFQNVKDRKNDELSK
jgi:hypothetical protein